MLKFCCTIFSLRIFSSVDIVLQQIHQIFPLSRFSAYGNQLYVQIECLAKVRNKDELQVTIS